MPPKHHDHDHKHHDHDHKSKHGPGHAPPPPPDELEAIAEHAGRYARKIFDETQHLGDGAEAFAAAIREEPIKAALIALGVGAVIGFLIRR